MSFQQFPPAGEFGTTGAPAPGGRRTALIVAGAAVLAAGAVAGVVMWSASGSNLEESVQNLARAPLGCTTALQFDEAGTYTIYVETVGSVGDVRGDCPNAESEYDYSGNGLPDAEITVVDEDGVEVDLNDDSSTEYHAGGAVGQSVATIQIDAPGDYDLTVSSDDDDDEFAVAVGQDPNEGADSLKSGGLAALIAGVVLGGLLLLLGLRKRPGRPGSPLPPAPPAMVFGGLQHTWAPTPPSTPAPPAPPASWPPRPAPPSGPPPPAHNWPPPPTG